MFLLNFFFFTPNTQKDAEIIVMQIKNFNAQNIDHSHFIV